MQSKYKILTVTQYYKLLFARSSYESPVLFSQQEEEAAGRARRGRPAAPQDARAARRSPRGRGK